MINIIKKYLHRPVKLRIISQLAGTRQVSVSYLDMTNIESAEKIGMNIAKKYSATVIDILDQDNKFIKHIRGFYE